MLFQAQTAKNAFARGPCPRPHQGSLQCSSEPLAI